MAGKLIRLAPVAFILMLVAAVLGGIGRAPAAQEGLLLDKELLLDQSEALFEGAEPFDPFPLRPPDTSSPRATLESFLQNASQAVRLFQSGAPWTAVRRKAVAAIRTLDLSELPPANRDSQGQERALLLLEIVGRIQLPPIEEVPGAEAVAEGDLASWTIPDTEITISRTDGGPHAGEFQFDAATVERLPEFYKRAEHLPYKPDAIIGAYELAVYSPGPWMPRSWTAGLPSFAHRVVLGLTIWQWVGTILTLGLSVAAITGAYVVGRRLDVVLGRQRGSGYLGRILAMVFAIVLTELAALFISDGVHIDGLPLLVVTIALRTVEVIAAGWLIMLALNAIGDWIIRFRGSERESVDAQLTSLVVNVLAIVVLIYLALYSAESFGIPAAPLLASLGVGGLAIALAVQPTLENLIGGFVLFADKPVKVGEFCKFGDNLGTIEQIGFRSTRVRGLDRTLIAVPNADFARLEITNFTRRDQMLVHTTLGLRYETTPDQLRFVLAKLREMFVAHPKVSPDPARARFIGFGESSLNIEIFLYVLTRDYDDFLSIAEDLNLRIMDIVAEAGTGFAFPSQISYVTRDCGMDPERTGAAEAEVRAWRSQGVLPFPWPDPERVAALDGKLDFPPEGSAQARPAAEPAPEPLPPQSRRHWGRGRSTKRS